MEGKEGDCNDKIHMYSDETAGRLWQPATSWKTGFPPPFVWHTMHSSIWAIFGIKSGLLNMMLLTLAVIRMSGEVTNRNVRKLPRQ